MMRLALITAIWLLAILTIVLLNSEHQPVNGGAPVVESAAGEAEVNMLRSPYPIAPQNIPRFIREEQA